MKLESGTRWSAVLLALTLSASMASFAQDRDRDRDRTTDQDRVTDQDRIRDQDRISDRDRVQDRIADRDRVQDRDQDRDRDRTQDRDRDRDRDQLHVRDRDQLRNRDIYGSQLMTRQELSQYRDRIRAMNSVREWAQFRAQHQNQMMARARERGVDLPPPVYGQQLTTDQERIRLREQLRDAANEQERERIRAEHREQVQQRARENQIPLSELGTD